MSKRPNNLPLISPIVRTTRKASKASLVELKRSHNATGTGGVATVKAVSGHTKGVPGPLADGKPRSRNTIDEAPQRAATSRAKRSGSSGSAVTHGVPTKAHWWAEGILRQHTTAASIFAEIKTIRGRLGVLEASYHAELHRHLASLYAIARHLYKDTDLWIEFYSDQRWRDASTKPNPTKPEDALRFVIRAALVGERRQVNDKSSRYTLALQEAWVSKRSPDEVLQTLEEVGIEGLRTRRLKAPEPEEASEEATEGAGRPRTPTSKLSERSETKSSVDADRDRVLEGEVLPKADVYTHKRRFPLEKNWRPGRYKGSIVVKRDPEKRRWLSVRLRRVE